jgi:peptidoglycan hydrolase CwlO-like protein
MTSKFSARLLRMTSVLLVSALVFALALPPVLPQALPEVFEPAQAYGITNDIDAAPDELQQRIEKSAADYDSALKNVASIEKKIEKNEKKIKELEELLPIQRERSSEAVSEYYRMTSTGNVFLELLFGSQSLSDLLANYEYASRLQSKFLDEVTRTKNMAAELSDTHDALEADRKGAVEEAKRAEVALTQAKAAREEAQRKAREAAEKAAKEAAEKKAAEKAKKKEEKKKTSQANQEESSESEPTQTPSDVDWSDDKKAFVKEWTKRIDKYLKGSPMAGHGGTFAEAAWDNGVDPRWSPAISYTESSRGLYCFLPHNAWGWGNVSWPDWDTAIRAHVQGLKRGYGYTISVAAAKKYCPPNWRHWYDVTLAQMETI